MELHYKKEVEYCMIATLIMNPELLKSIRIKEEHFYKKNNVIAYKVLNDMVKDGEEINLVTFGSRFYDKGGKMSEIKALFAEDKYWSALNAETYLRQLAEELVKRRILEKYESLQEAPKEFIEEVKKIELEFVDCKASSLLDLYDGYIEQYNTRKEKLASGGSVGVTTGFKVIDEKCGFEEGNLVILAAKTSVGKTALALNMAVNASMFDQDVLFFSAEMTTKELMNRVFAQLSGVSSTKFKYCNADNTLPLIKNEINRCGKHLKLIEAGTLTSDDICRISSQQETKPKLVVVDYIQYLKDRTAKGGNNNDRIGLITRNLKELAVRLECTVLALSQVNRATDGTPALHNLRDSGNIEQDADAVLILHRENREDVIADIIIAKNRNGQVFADGKLKFKPELTKFYE